MLYLQNICNHIHYKSSKFIHFFFSDRCPKTHEKYANMHTYNIFSVYLHPSVGLIRHILRHNVFGFAFDKLVLDDTDLGILDL